MNLLIDSGIKRWRSLRNREMLKSAYSTKYAFVGVGSHSLQNLYPILQYLGLKLKYICCKSQDKLSLIERRFGVTATTSLDMILNDSEVKGIFVCTSPYQHYDLCSRIISSGKYLFVEKPPCLSLEQLEKLIEADEQHKTMVGMQKRYSPLVETLKRRLSKSEVLSYTMTYNTGAYPEGDAFYELFIHPVDLVSYIFGKVEIKATQLIDYRGTTTVHTLVSHDKIKGILELSTAHSWSNSTELLRVNTLNGEYRLEQMERLLHYPYPKKVVGIPIEKIGLFTSSAQILAERNNFNPLVSNNQLYTQGFLSEIKAFAEMVEHSGKNMSPLLSLRDVYIVLNSLNNTL